MSCFVVLGHVLWIGGARAPFCSSATALARRIPPGKRTSSFNTFAWRYVRKYFDAMPEEERTAEVNAEVVANPTAPVVCRHRARARQWRGIVVPRRTHRLRKKTPLSLVVDLQQQQSLVPPRRDEVPVAAYVVGQTAMHPTAEAVRQKILEQLPRWAALFGEPEAYHLVGDSLGLISQVVEWPAGNLGLFAAAVARLAAKLHGSGLEGTGAEDPNFEGQAASRVSRRTAAVDQVLSSFGVVSMRSVCMAEACIVSGLSATQ